MMLAQVLASSSISQDLFQWQVPPLEKVIRTVAVYLVIAALIRLAGKRLMAQMNSLDLVVVLLLSNVVQNAIIGDDNSLAGGVLGAVVLVAFNAVLDRVAQHVPAVRFLLEGRPTVLVEDGKRQDKEIAHLGMTDEELTDALHTQGADSIDEVKQARIVPGGEISVALKPEEQSVSRKEFSAAMSELRELIVAQGAR